MMSESKDPRERPASPAEPSGPRARPRRRRGTTPRDDRGRLPRPLLLALLAVIAAGAYLFWPQGGGEPPGIGEQLTVVTADSTDTTRPRSGSVDIDDQQTPLVPEEPEPAAANAGSAGGGGGPAAGPRPEGDAAGGDAARSDAETPPAGGSATPPDEPAGEPAGEEQPAAAAPSSGSSGSSGASGKMPESEPPRIEPRATGPWALQVGAFQAEENADGLVQTLASRGYEAQVRAAGTSSGAIVYRVWVGWFATRQQAASYAAQEGGPLGEAFPQHR